MPPSSKPRWFEITPPIGCVPAAVWSLRKTALKPWSFVTLLMTPMSCGASPLTADECTWVSVFHHWSALAAVGAAKATRTVAASAHAAATRLEARRRRGRVVEIKACVESGGPLRERAAPGGSYARLGYWFRLRPSR